MPAPGADHAVDHDAPTVSDARELRIDPNAGVFPADGGAAAGAAHARPVGNIFTDWLAEYERGTKPRNYGIQLVIIHDRIENVTRRMGYRHGKRLLDIWDTIASVRTPEQANAVLPAIPAHLSTALAELRGAGKISPEDEATVAKDFDELLGRASRHFGVPAAQ